MKKTPTVQSPTSSPRDRIYPEGEFLTWIHEAKEAAYLGADNFERFFTIGDEKMLCSIEFYWTEKADMTPRISKIECLPVALLPEE